MNKLTKYACILTTLAGAVACSDGKKAQGDYAVIPLPQEITQGGNTPFLLKPSTPISYQEGDAEMEQTARFLASYVKEATGYEPKVIAGNADRGIHLSIASDIQHPEGYRLLVSENGIEIAGASNAGIFYGVQTLRKSIPAVAVGMDVELPSICINDYPRFPYRGMHLDVSRHFFPTDSVKKFIDMLALHNMNRFHWHLTEDQGWRIEIKKYPKLTEIGSKREKTLVDYYYVNYPQVFDGEEHGGYYTQEQIKDVVAYAASKYINVVPEIEMPGHALAALASYPELSCDSTQTYKVSPTWGVFEQVFCPSETTFKFFEGVMDEVVELFPSEYIHIGGDECPKTAWKNSAFCQQLIRQLGLKDDVTPSKVDGVKHSKEDKLQSYFVTRMEKYLNDKGRNIIGWDEILEGGLAPNATVMSWRGVEGGLNAAKAGHNAIMTPMPYAYLDFYQEDPAIAPTTIGGYTTLKKTYSYNPAPDDADELVKKHVIGMQGNIWREYMKNSDRTDYQAFPRAMAIAETGWTLDANIMAGRD